MKPRVLLLCCLAGVFFLSSCGNRNVRYGVGIGIQMEAPPGMKRGLGLSSWYTSSSTSSSTMTKEEYLGTALQRFLEQENRLVAEELAQGEGTRLHALAFLALVPPENQFHWLSQLRRQCAQSPVELQKQCFWEVARDHQIQVIKTEEGIHVG